ncbi:hypothetical protein B0H16DRAFT_1454129 [Mycena metata]|uniref:Uncharacterized protein n=1 Tax=Mycena metata TaxID=1033252 RepID=A0AAD7JJN2_9AGAR|nr:hypothetical protein B0H16DRAFT_1454129 [Mycena metata]
MPVFCFFQLLPSCCLLIIVFGRSVRGYTSRPPSLLNYLRARLADVRAHAGGRALRRTYEGAGLAWRRTRTAARARSRQVAECGVRWAVPGIGRGGCMDRRRWRKGATDVAGACAWSHATGTCPSVEAGQQMWCSQRTGGGRKQAEKRARVAVFVGAYPVGCWCTEAMRFSGRWTHSRLSAWVVLVPVLGALLRSARRWYSLTRWGRTRAYSGVKVEKCCVGGICSSVEAGCARRLRVPARERSALLGADGEAVEMRRWIKIQGSGLRPREWTRTFVCRRGQQLGCEGATLRRARTRGRRWASGQPAWDSRCSGCGGGTNKNTSAFSPLSPAGATTTGRHTRGGGYMLRTAQWGGLRQDYHYSFSHSPFPIQAGRWDWRRSSSIEVMDVARTRIGKGGSAYYGDFLPRRAQIYHWHIERRHGSDQLGVLSMDTE